MQRFVLITGASSGIGLDCARLLISCGYRVIGTLRREAEGQRLRAELGEAFLPLLLDVTDQAALPAAVRRVEAWVGARGWRRWSTTPASPRPAARCCCSRWRRSAACSRSTCSACSPSPRPSRRCLARAAGMPGPRGD